jgi:MYXO-CTERM domain-containing protein
VPPRRAGTVFYGIWPALIVAAGVFHRRRQA